MPRNQVPKAYNGISTDFIYAGRTDLIGGTNKTFGTFNRNDAPAVFQSPAAPWVPFKALTSPRSEGAHVINTARHLSARKAHLPIGHLLDLGAGARIERRADEELHGSGR